MWYNLYIFIAFFTSSLEAFSLSINIDIDGPQNVESNSTLEKDRQVVNSVGAGRNKCEKKPMPDLSKFAKRISEVKCMEYAYELVERQENKNLGSNDEKDLSIYHGKEVKAAEFPHMGALGWALKFVRKPIFLCAATLISERFMLTAAQCVYSNRDDLESPEPYFVRLGTRYVKTSPVEPPKIVYIETLITYSEYKSPLKYNDIALVKLNENVKFSKFIMPACLVTNETNYTRRNTVVTGWGFNDDSSIPTNALLYTDVRILDNEICDYLLQHNQDVKWKGMQPHQMCAIQKQYGTGVCTGDSGGPLQYLILKMPSAGSIHGIISVTSRGFTECSSNNEPGLYTRVSSYLDWIESYVWSEEY